MKVSDYIVEFLKEENVDTVFGYQGGAITNLVDSIFKAENIKFISLYNEQAAAFAAEGYSRVNGNIGVALATSGPGATNLITGIGSCFFDSIACVFITGQVNLYEFKRNDKIRQEGFQETEIVRLVEPITKYSIMIRDESKIRYELEKAFYIARNGRKGPVLIDIPMNIQKAEIEYDKLSSFYSSEEYLELQPKFSHESKINYIIKLIKNSERPIILAGGGVRSAGATGELEELSNITGIPVVTTLMGLDSIDNYNPNHVGYMGVYGTRYANLAAANCDLLIVLGSRLTSRQTSTNVKSFAREAKIVHVDIDENELNLKIKEDISLKCDLKVFMNTLLSKIGEEPFEVKYIEWKERIELYKKQYPTYPTQKENGKIDPNEILHLINEACAEDSVICLDVGQNQIWASQSMKLKKNQRILNAGGMGAMGFSLPAAIGAYYANNKSKIIVIAGDGGIQMNIQELQTIVREKLPIKIIVMNNHALGMIRHFQELYFDSKYYGTIEGYSAPDFCKIAEAYGIRSYKVNNINQINNIKDIMNNDNCNLIEIDLSKMTYVIPKLEMGNPIEQQSPLVSIQELSRNMIIDIYKK